MTTGQTIKASEYNAIRVKIEQVLNTGGIVGGIKGYGQKLISEPVLPGDDNNPDPLAGIITRDQWEALRRDIINIKIHQENPRDNQLNPVVPNVLPIPVGEPIRYGPSQPNNNFDILIDQLASTSLTVGEGRYLISAVPDSPKIRAASWNTQVSCVVEVTFTGYTRPDGYVVSPVNHARFFFNSGGKFRIYSGRTGGSPTSQNNSWTTLLIQAASRELGALIPENLNFYNLTNAYQTLFQLSSSGVYASNKYRIEAKCNVPNNSQGTATTLFFRIYWIDDYVDTNPSPPADSVDGTLSLSFEEIKPAGPIFNSVIGAQPTGSWYLPSPTYSITSIA